MERSILVVEDSATQAMALCSVLEQASFKVTRVASGEDAIEFLWREPVDLVLSDIVMPGMSGYDLCREIKADPELALLPVVLLTSLSDPLDIVRGLECGADNYVTKPYDPEYLCARIRHVFDRQRLRMNPKASLGVNVSFLGTSFSITSEKEQILDLFISTVEDVVRTNRALQESQRELAEAQARLEEHARGMTLQAEASTEKYATLMHNASDAIAVLDIGGRIVEANQRALELFGTTAEELRGRALRDFAASRSLAQLDRELERVRELSRITAEADFVHRSGSVATCILSASRSRSAAGELILAILHDVTAIREADSRVHKSQSQLAQAQQVSAIGSWERDLATGAQDWSAETFRILGLPTSATPDFDAVIASMVDPADAPDLVAARKALAETGKPLSVTFRFTRPDGAVRVVQGHGEVVRDEHGVPRRVLGTLQDITERRQLEEELHQSRKMEAVGQLAGGIAHDFNNLLTVITSYSSMLLNDLPATDSKHADVKEIEDAAQRAAALTRQLLAFSRRQVLQPQRIDPTALIGQLDKLLRRLVREDIRIVTSLDPDTGSVWADPGQLEQVIMNLAVNARDAMPKGGTLTIRTAKSPYPPGLANRPRMDGAADHCVVIEVADTGTGMSPAVKARIFEPFFTTKPPGQGTGLGLSTVFGIIKQSGGDIEVRTAPGAGTTFLLYLPARNGTGEVHRGDKPRAGASRGAGEAILIVEDDNALRAVAARVLRQQGYHVLESNGGREALEICGRKDTPLHLVLTDVVMPDMSGPALGERIATLRPEVAILYMSGYTADTPVSDLTYERGAYLEKPFTPETLGKKVREVLDGHRRHGPDRAGDPPAA